MECVDPKKDWVGRILFQRLGGGRREEHETFIAMAAAGAVTLVARHGVVASLEAVGYQDW